MSRERRLVLGGTVLAAAVLGGATWIIGDLEAAPLLGPGGDEARAMREGGEADGLAVGATGPSAREVVPVEAAGSAEVDSVEEVDDAEAVVENVHVALSYGAAFHEERGVLWYSYPLLTGSADRGARILAWGIDGDLSPTLLASAPLSANAPARISVRRDEVGAYRQIMITATTDPGANAEVLTHVVCLPAPKPMVVRCEPGAPRYGLTVLDTVDTSGRPVGRELSVAPGEAVDVPGELVRLVRGSS